MRNERQVVEVALRSSAALERDLPHQPTEPVDDRALHLVHCAARVDDLRLPMSPATQTLFTFTCSVGVDAHFGDLGEIAAMAVLERDAHPGARGSVCASPSRTSPANFSTLRMRPAS